MQVQSLLPFDFLIQKYIRETLLVTSCRNTQKPKDKDILSWVIGCGFKPLFSYIFFIHHIFFFWYLFDRKRKLIKDIEPRISWRPI